MKRKHIPTALFKHLIKLTLLAKVAWVVLFMLTSTYDFGASDWRRICCETFILLNTLPSLSIFTMNKFTLHTLSDQAYYNNFVNWSSEFFSSTAGQHTFPDILACSTEKNPSQEWLNAFSGLTFPAWYVAALQRPPAGVWPKSHRCLLLLETRSS